MWVDVCIFITSAVAIISCYALIRFGFEKNKKELDIKLENAKAIKKQLEIATLLDDKEGKMHDGAVCFCKKVEQDIFKQYNDLMKKPSYYVTAKMLGYPIKLTVRY